MRLRSDPLEALSARLGAVAETRAPEKEKPAPGAGFSKRLMGLEPTTFCMAIVSANPVNPWFCGLA
jgi:hypothetical protein